MRILPLFSIIQPLASSSPHKMTSLPRFQGDTFTLSHRPLNTGNTSASTSQLKILNSTLGKQAKSLQFGMNATPAATDEEINQWAGEEEDYPTPASLEEEEPDWWRDGGVPLTETDDSDPGYETDQSSQGSATSGFNTPNVPSPPQRARFHSFQSDEEQDGASSGDESTTAREEQERFPDFEF